jgi:flagellar hook-basal body complex protein FliE
MTQIGSISGAPGQVIPQEIGRVATPFGNNKGTSFADTLQRALGEVSVMQTEAQDAIGAFVRGEPIEIHEVMAAAEEAGIALEMLIEIRNKLTEAYRSVMQMQQ